MKTNRAVLWLFIALSATVMQATAAEKQVTYKLTGKHAGGSLHYYDPAANFLLIGAFQPVELWDGAHGVFATWSVCASPSVPDPTSSLVCADQVIGVFPPSSVTAAGRGDEVQVDFDTSNALIILFSVAPSRWKGTLTRYTGVGSFATTTTGAAQTTVVEPAWFGAGSVTFTSRSTGRREQGSAIFRGTMGPAIITAPPLGGNSFLSHETGGTAQVVYPGP